MEVRAGRNEGHAELSDLGEWMCGHSGGVVQEGVGCVDPELRGAWLSVSCHMNNSEGMLGLNGNSIPEGAELGDMR